MEVSKMELKKTYYGTISRIGGKVITSAEQAQKHIDEVVDVNKDFSKWMHSEVERLGPQRYVINEFYQKEV